MTPISKTERRIVLGGFILIVFVMGLWEYATYERNDEINYAKLHEDVSIHNILCEDAYGMQMYSIPIPTNATKEQVLRSSRAFCTKIIEGELRPN